MMQPSDVNDEMQISAAQALYVVSCGELEAASHEMRAPITAAINAMPDDLLRKLVAERGCVMVPREPTEAMLDAMYRRPWDMLDNELREMWAEILAASDPRHQADKEPS